MGGKESGGMKATTVVSTGRYLGPGFGTRSFRGRSRPDVACPSTVSKLTFSFVSQASPGGRRTISETFWRVLLVDHWSWADCRWVKRFQSIGFLSFCHGRRLDDYVIANSSIWCWRSQVNMESHIWTACFVFSLRAVGHFVTCSGGINGRGNLGSVSSIQRCDDARSVSVSNAMGLRSRA